jgi:integrase
MTAMLVNTLKEWKIAYPRPFAEGRDEEGKPVRETPRLAHLVFPNGHGRVENHGNLFARVFAPAWIAAGAMVDSGKLDKKGRPILRAKYGIHGLRHFFASWLINEKSRGGLDVSLKRAQVLLGHSSLQMTADTYGHLLPAKGDEAEEFSVGEQALMA